MSLQGTLATFSIPDVMRLLSSTSKSGRLTVTGDAGRGDVWLATGKVVAAESAGETESTDPVTVLFGLLRLDDGDFVFEDGVEPAEAGDAVEVDELLGKAEELAEEWATLVAVVPSASAWVSLVAELPADEVEIERDDWRTIVAVGSGATAGRLAELLEVDLIGAMRAVKELVDDHLVEVAEEAPEGADEPAPAAESGGWEPTIVVDDEPAPPAVEEPDEAPAFEPVEVAPAADEAPSWESLEPVPHEDDDGDQADARSSYEEGQEFDPNALMREMGMGGDDDGFLPDADGGLGGLGGGEIGADDAAEMARQLANLSPEAAKAVAAAAKATSDFELQAALDEVVALDSSINRDLLMKFLGSVNS